MRCAAEERVHLLQRQAAYRAKLAREYVDDMMCSDNVTRREFYRHRALLCQRDSNKLYADARMWLLRW